MTFKQLEQFLKEENRRDGAQREWDACGKYARCAYCDRSVDYPCARAYDALVKKGSEETENVLRLPEHDVKGRFGTALASGDEGKRYVVARLSFKSREKKTGVRILIIRRRAK